MSRGNPGSKMSEPRGPRQQLLGQNWGKRTWPLYKKILVAVIKTLTKQLKGDRVYFGSRLRKARKTWWQNLEAVGHTAPIVQKLTNVDGSACFLLLLSLGPQPKERYRPQLR